MCRSVLAPSGLSSTPALKTRAPSRTGVGFVCETLQRRFPRRLHASTTRPQVGRLPLLQPRGLPRRAARRRLAAEADGGRPARAGCGLAAQPRGRHAAAADGAGTFQRTSRDSTALLTRPAPSSQEKNWSPFVHAGELHLSYSLEPHVVLRCGWSGGGCAVAHNTSSPFLQTYRALGQELRGGSPQRLAKT